LEGLIKTYKIIDAINRKAGLTASWLALAMVLVQFSVVVSRYVFAVGSVPAQETIWYMHGSLFMLGAGYTLLRDGHVRVDVFYRESSAKKRAKVDLFGIIVFLIPTSLFILYSSSSYIVNSWNVLEGSTETNGLPLTYVLKTVIPIATLLLLMQAVSMGIQTVITLRGGEDRKPEMPDETGTLVSNPRADCNRVLTLAIYLFAIELFTFIISIAQIGLTISIGRLVVLTVLLYLAFRGKNSGRVALVVGLFVAAGFSIYTASVASGDPGAILTVLSYGNVAGAVILTIVPWTEESTPRKLPAFGPGFAVVVAVVVYVLASEMVWLVDTLVTLSGGITIKTLPSWVGPALLRILLVAAVAAAFFRGSTVARWTLTALLVSGFVYSLLQTLYSPAEGVFPLVGTGGIVVGVLHLLVAGYLMRSETVGRFLEDQRQAKRELVPIKEISVEADPPNPPGQNIDPQETA